VLQHVSFEDMGVFTPVLREVGYDIRHVQAGVEYVKTDEWLAADLAVILGGPIGVGQEDMYPFLLEERELARARLVSGRPLLGICLGAQIMAAALGARVYAGQKKEIGWGGVELTEEGRNSPLGELAAAPVLHWHGDTFDMPLGARRLAFTALTPNQAFSAGRGQLALQFHPEVDAGRMETWLVGHCCELAAAGLAPARIREDARALGDAAGGAGRRFLRRWLVEELSAGCAWQ
jgi:GMP synthase (glutamine-hydrolysing)